MRTALRALTILALAAFGCSKDDGHSTIHKGAEDVETEINHAPQTLKHGADDVDESARGLVGEDDHKTAAPAKTDSGKGGEPASGAAPK